MESRVASSLERAAPRASSRLATFTQAIEQDEGGHTKEQREAAPATRSNTWLCPRDPGSRRMPFALNSRHRPIAQALLERRLHFIDDRAIGRVDHGARLLRHDARFQPGEQVNPVPATVSGGLSGQGCMRQRIVIGTKTWGLSPGVASSKPSGVTPTTVSAWPLTNTRLADGSRTAAKVGLPVRVTQHHDLGAADVASVVRSQEASQRRSQTQNRKVTARHEQALALQGLAAIAKVDVKVAVRRDAGEDRLEALQIAEHRIAEERVAGPLDAARFRPRLGSGRDQIHEAVGIGHRQWPEQKLVELREHRRICADAERQRQHCHRGETGSATKHPQRVAEVLAARSAMNSVRIIRRLRRSLIATHAVREPS